MTAAGVVDLVARDGPVTFARYMELSLYHPELGYYASGATRTGRAGHFLTSSELDPAFGRLWAAGFERVWAACGRPRRFDVVELGPGEGGFAAAVLDAVDGDFAGALHYHLVERVARVEARQRELLSSFERVSWHPDIEDVGRVGAGCVFANEVFDNLPVHLVEHLAGELREVFVVADGGGLATVPGPPSTPAIEQVMEETEMVLPEGARTEVGLAAVDLARRAARALEAGSVVVVDYGLESAELSARPAGTLAAYSGDGADDRVLERPGERDITAHVSWSALRWAFDQEGLAVTGPRPQRDVLLELGAAEMAESLRREHRAAAAAGRGAEAVRALSRSQAIAALIDPGGLGALGVLTGARAPATQPFFPS